MSLLLRHINRLSRLPQTRLTLQNFYVFKNGKQSQIRSAKFLKKEMSIRLSKRIMELNEVKFGLAYNPHFIKTRKLYEDSVDRLLSHVEIKNEVDLNNFTRTVKEIKEKHHNVIEIMSQGVLSVSDKLQPVERTELDDFLNHFYGSRIGIRLLMGQFISLVGDKPGVITQFKPIEVINQVQEEVKYMSDQCYPGSHPEFKVLGDHQMNLIYSPAFLKYIYIEVLKNATRATMEHSPREPITTTLIQGVDDLIIKVSDQGGGFSRQILPNVFNYSFTTCYSPDDSLYTDSGPKMAGLGYGVPLSRLYARYFGGDLVINPYHGIGTESIIYINLLTNIEEDEH